MSLNGYGTGTVCTLLLIDSIPRVQVRVWREAVEADLGESMWIEHRPTVEATALHPAEEMIWVFDCVDRSLIKVDCTVCDQN